MQAAPPPPALPQGVCRLDLHVPAFEDGWPIAMTVFEPAQEQLAKNLPAVIVGHATGVPARFYQSFAAWLASRGAPAATFDLRLCGASFADDSGSPIDGMKLSREERREHLVAKGRDVGFEVWASRDYAAAIASLHDRYCTGTGRRRRPFVLVGNSLGGQIAPIAAHALQKRPETQHVRIDRALTFGSTSPHSGWFPDPEAQFAEMGKLRKAIESAGYLSLEAAGLAGQDMPRLAAINWFTGVDKRNYIAGLGGVISDAYSAWRIPTMNLYMTDDFLCLGQTPRMSHAFARALGKADSIESEDERSWWEDNEDGRDTTGSRAWLARRSKGVALPPDPPEAPRPFPCASIFVDVTAHGWVKDGSRAEDPRPRVIGHVDGFKGSAILKAGSRSAELWEGMMWDWIAEGRMPKQSVLRGIGLRRDFGIVEAPASKL